MQDPYNIYGDGECSLTFYSVMLMSRGTLCLTRASEQRPSNEEDTRADYLLSKQPLQIEPRQIYHCARRFFNGTRTQTYDTRAMSPCGRGSRVV
ncbi:hypothetical protein TNCV_863811 [Trichonephila clavipes]|nr:hypothetical protein TNCV_863811 [Trichonephila clavipes]